MLVRITCQPKLVDYGGRAHVFLGSPPKRLRERESPAQKEQKRRVVDWWGDSKFELSKDKAVAAPPDETLLKVKTPTAIGAINV